MNKRKLIISLWSSVIFTSIASGLIASIAWFSTSNNVKVDVTGSVVEEYFHCGDGTVQNPFVITRPIHYYHLVEFYQRETTVPIESAPKFGRDYLYFQIGYDLDEDGDLEVFSYDDQGIYEGTFQNPAYSNVLNMAYYSGTNALLPIGTNEVPFIGSFDGKAAEGISVSNINICCAEDVLVGNTRVSRAASDVGIFGYVADADYASNATIIKNAIFDNVTIDLTDISSTVNPSTITGQQAVPHTSAHAGVAHVGYIAGHIHTYTNYVNANTPAAPIHDVYVSNATIKGGAGAHCDFGYIGLVDDLSGNTSASVAGEVSQLNTGGGGQGQGHEWGGSMNFQDFNRRIKAQLTNASAVTYQQNPTGSSSSTSTSYQRFRSYQNSYLSASIYYGSSIMSNIVNKNPDTTRVIYNYLDEGDYTRSGYINVTGIPGTVQPLITASGDYFTPDSNNTGYIISGVANKNYANNNYGMTVRTASYEARFIANAMGDTTYSTSSINSGTANGKTNGTAVTFPSYNKAKLEILTNSSATYGANNYYYIKDELSGYNQNHAVNYNYTKSDNTTPTALKLTKYNESRASLDDILSGQSYIHGLHFVGSSVTYNNYVTRSNLKILGSTKNNYKLPKNSIDFNLLEAGKINFFAGSYYSRGTPTTSSVFDSNSDNFFALYHIVRSNDDLVSTSVKKISVIFENTDTSLGTKYVYQYSDSSYSSGTRGTRLFDLSYLDHCPVNNALYYFEIPVDAGEYALGAANSSSSSYGGYLMYLDIGTSGEAQEPTINQENEIKDAPLFTQIDFQTDSFVINSCFNVAYVIPTGSTKETFSITISCGSVEVAGEDQSTTTYTCYEIVITNGSGNDFILNALLMDDDGDNNNAYTYMYAITYNGGTRTEYFTSNSFTGASGGSSMTPTYQQSGS